MTRVAVLWAADAPAATIVVDGSFLEPSATRAAVERLLDTIRKRVLLYLPTVPRLGLKNIVVFSPVGRTLRVEFFQGEAFGPLVAESQEVCVNSALCAVQAARNWALTPPGTMTVLMGGSSFEFAPPVPSSPSGP